jgi:phage terminase large subunit-like protein
VIQRIWTPEETLADRAHRDRAPYLVWAEQGRLTVVAGSSIDHDVVRQAIVEARSRFDILQIGFDPWHAETPIQNLVKLDGFAETQVLSVPQTFAGLSAACLRVQADILAGDIDAGGCPVTAWAVSNVVDQRDGKDNMLFIKKKSRGRIDPVMSFTNAMALAIRHQAEQPVGIIAEWA